MLVLDESAAWIQAHFRGFRARKHVAAGNHSFAEDDEASLTPALQAAALS